MITSKVFTIETRLDNLNNKELVDYLSEFCIYYNQILRKAWHIYKKCQGFPESKNKFNTYLQNKFSISKRIANSIINDIQGKYRALTQLKWYEHNNLYNKIQSRQKNMKN